MDKREIIAAYMLKLARAPGIEPGQAGLESAVLPLHKTPIVPSLRVSSLGYGRLSSYLLYVVYSGSAAEVKLVRAAGDLTRRVRVIVTSAGG
jgi:hypothetical protein